MSRTLRSWALCFAALAAGHAGLAAGSSARAQVGFSYSNWGGRGGFSVGVGNPYGWGYPVYAAPVYAPVPVVASPIVVVPRYPVAYGYPVAPYWSNRWAYGPRPRYGPGPAWRPRPW